MADVTVRTEGGEVTFEGVTMSGAQWIERNVFAAYGSNSAGADDAVDLIHKAVHDGVEVRLVR